VTPALCKPSPEGGITESTVSSFRRDDIGLVLSRTLDKRTPSTLKKRSSKSIAKSWRPGDPPTLRNTATNPLPPACFFDPRKYDFSRVRAA